MSHYTVTIADRSFEVELIEKTASSVRFVCMGKTHEVQITGQPKMKLSSAGASPRPIPSSSPRTAKVEQPRIAGQIYAPMPGIIVDVRVQEGDEVHLGQTLIVMEAMKMENNISAPCSGRIRSIHIQAGVQVENACLLLSIDPQESSSGSSE